MNKFSKIALGAGSAFLICITAITLLDPSVGKIDNTTSATAEGTTSPQQEEKPSRKDILYHRPDIHEKKSQKYIDQAMSYLGNCSKWSDLTGCMEHQDQFVRQYVNAVAGDYAAQKDILFDFMVSDGQDGAVATNKIQGCAWAQVISASGSPYLTQNDQSMMVLDCDGLRPMDVSAAKKRASAISQLIATAHVQRLPVPQIDYDPREGKDETEADQE